MPIDPPDVDSILIRSRILTPQVTLYIVRLFKPPAGIGNSEADGAKNRRVPKHGKLRLP